MSNLLFAENNFIGQSCVGILQNELPDSIFEADTSAPLNHNFSKDRARLVQAGKVAKKPPNRSQSSTMLVQGKAIRNTSF